MKKEKSFSVAYTEFAGKEDLPESIRSLMAEAIKARQNAYAPYSEFSVGAAVLLANGAVVIGSNQENAAYPSGLCAERVAIYQASALYPNEVIKAIAVSGSARKPTNVPVSPCGACRQSMAEYETRQKEPIAVYFMGAEGSVIQAYSVKDLIPFLFDGSLL